MEFDEEFFKKSLKFTKVKMANKKIEKICEKEKAKAFVKFWLCTCLCKFHSFNNLNFSSLYSLNLWGMILLGFLLCH